MTNKRIATMTLAAGAVAAVADQAAAAKKKKAPAKKGPATLDEALALLKTYDWGEKRSFLNLIDKAVIATHGDAAGRKKLEKSLVDALTGKISRSAQDFICRRLRVIGTASSVKALAALLADEETSAIARFALADISDDSAVDALRAALPKVSSKIKPGIIGSLGMRRDKKSTAAIAKLLGDSDILVARAAARALALIGTTAAARALSACAKKAPAKLKMNVSDACLVCAEQLLADGEKTAAIAMYNGLKGADQSKHVKVAAMKGLLTAASKK
ncbi:MAG: HEAT repeat domain-containing protein [Phycisphaerae bacterium]|jgi:HEAT repeat protein|nr:HEAT repeat domain-containing protein [Phycisphaerae bacterium]